MDSSWLYVQVSAPPAHLHQVSSTSNYSSHINNLLLEIQQSLQTQQVKNWSDPFPSYIMLLLLTLLPQWTYLPRCPKLNPGRHPHLNQSPSPLFSYMIFDSIWYFSIPSFFILNIHVFILFLKISYLNKWHILLISLSDSRLLPFN